MRSMVFQDNTKHRSDMLTRIFCDIDDFFQTFEPQLNKFLLETCCKKRIRSCRISLSEVTITVVQFHRSGYRCFKDFYLKSITCHYRHLFPERVSYHRFVELMPKALLALGAFMKSRYGKLTGISYIDSTGLSVCTNRRSGAIKPSVMTLGEENLLRVGFSDSSSTLSSAIRVKFLT